MPAGITGLTRPPGTISPFTPGVAIGPCSGGGAPWKPTVGLGVAAPELPVVIEALPDGSSLCADGSTLGGGSPPAVRLVFLLAQPTNARSATAKNEDFAFM